MATARRGKTDIENGSVKAKSLTLLIRFNDAAHRALVEEAAKEGGNLSMNAWIARATIAQAKLELSQK